MDSRITQSKEQIAENLGKIELDKIIDGIILHDTSTTTEDITNNPPSQNDFPVIELNIHQFHHPRTYETFFQSDGNSNISLTRKLSSLSFSELKNDMALLKKIPTFQKDECIKIEDWEIISDTSSVINDFESKFQLIVSKINRRDIYNLYEVIKKCNLYNFTSRGSVGPISTLEYMVESACAFDKSKGKSMAEHVVSLEDFVFRWRGISDDGNCFYRAVIFAFLENLILEKNLVLIKNLMIEIDEKFEENYSNTRYLPLIKKEISKIDKQLLIQILYLICEVIENSPENLVNAYEILLTSFIFCQHFDFSLIMYFRYKIYEFIKENWNKVYSQDFAVKIGNLLPSHYETDNGDFLYDLFFEELLLRLGTDAEKIVIYLTPFVLKVDLRIVMYDFLGDSSPVEKNFPCCLPNKPQITLLYRNSHYDLVYTEKYFHKFSQELSHYVNLSENLRSIDTSYLETLKRQKFSQLQLKRQLSGGSSSNNMLASSTQQLQVGGVISRAEAITSIEEEFPKCASCGSSYMHRQNILNLCVNCLESEFLNQLMAGYLIFIADALEYYKSRHEENISHVFNEGNKYACSKKYCILVFNTRVVSFYNKPITLSNAAEIAGKNLLEVLRTVKEKICVFCQNNVKTGNAYSQLPCNCIFCSKKCFDDYFKIVFLQTKRKVNNFSCICGYQFNNNDFRLIYEFLEKNKFKDYKKQIELIVIFNLKRACLICLYEYCLHDKKFYMLTLKDKEFTNLYKIKEFKHIICKDCFSKTQITEKSNIECCLCNSSHRIEKIKKITEDDDEDCSIL